MEKELSGSADTGRPEGVRVTAEKCVRCKEAVVPRFRPFCSLRCSNLDLSGWLTSQYRIRTDEIADVTEYEPVVDDD
ncbi:MAG: DNA gyrase inhibitor YacG [Rhodospirillaceae bacterium]|jgi:endogenous inhibitor of DNA gyrase (YacG/DUF329 family)|nr:DNA gyrase inhibitor YacG [Rhodospirillaceae bacterium]